MDKEAFFHGFVDELEKLGFLAAEAAGMAGEQYKKNMGQFQQKYGRKPKGIKERLKVRFAGGLLGPKI